MSFALDLAEFARKAEANAEQVIQKVTIDLLSAIVDRSPVGNPELWAANATATEYNTQVSLENARLRSDPANLTKAGRLKAGKKINDSMTLTSGSGYVGGRFRGNWQASFEVAAKGETGRVDGQGQATKAAGTAVLQAYQSAIGTIWLMNNVPYSVRLEYGHSSQAPAGVVRITVAEFQTFVDAAVRGLPD